MKEIKLAMLGMVDGNGHPYSWSAIFNGYNKDLMEDCGYPVIPRYLEKQPPETFGIKGAKVTHIWCDDPEDAKKVAKASLVPNIPASTMSPMTWTLRSTPWAELCMTRSLP